MEIGYQLIYRSLPHRKLLDNTTGGKLTPVAISPDDILTILPSDCAQIVVPTVRHTSITTLVFLSCVVFALHVLILGESNSKLTIAILKTVRNMKTFKWDQSCRFCTLIDGKNKESIDSGLREKNSNKLKFWNNFFKFCIYLYAIVFFLIYVDYIIFK